MGTGAGGGCENGVGGEGRGKEEGIGLDTEDESGASLPVTAVVDQFYKDVQALGGGRWDSSSLIKRLRALS